MVTDSGDTEAMKRFDAKRSVVTTDDDVIIPSQRDNQYDDDDDDDGRVYRGLTVERLRHGRLGDVVHECTQMFYIETTDRAVNYTVRHKKHTKILLCITSRNINRLS